MGAQLAPNDTINYGTGIIQNTGAFSQMGIDILSLINVTDVKIKGIGTVLIKYKKGLKYGGVTNGGTSCNYALGSACSNCPNSNNYASVGVFLKIENSSCVFVGNINVNGNAQFCSKLGFYGECGSWQLPYDGCVIIGGSNIELNNFNAKYFGRDGVMMAAYLNNINPNDIVFESCKFVGNCRQGFSFTSGNVFKAENCDFDSTGVIFQNNPGCGVDIEPDPGSSCTNASFDNCNFRHNIFVGMISDLKYPFVNSITFNDCEFFASYPGSWSIWPNRMGNTNFNNCKIKGQLCHVAGTSSNDLITFTTCNFSDWDGNFSSKVSGWNNYLLNLGAPGSTENVFLKLSSCAIDIHHSLLIYMEPQGLPRTANDRVFINNVIKVFVDDLKNNTISGFPPIGWPTNNMSSLGSFYSSYISGNRVEDANPLTYPPYNPPPGAPLFYMQNFWIGFMNNLTLTPSWCCVCNQSLQNCSCTVSKLQKLNNSNGTNFVTNTTFNGPFWSRVTWNSDQQCTQGANGGNF